MRGTTNVPSVYVLVSKDDRLAFVLREHTGYMDGKYSLPAGHVEDGESFTTAAPRETLEEINVHVSVKNLKHVHTMHRNCGDHVRVDVYFEATEWTGEPRNNEPDMHSQLDWFLETELPADKIMDYQYQALQAIMRGETYSERGWSE